MTMIYGPSCCAHRSRGIRAYGNENTEVLFVGIAPGRVEEEQGRPGVGPTGHLLDQTLIACDCKREDFAMTNTICWRNDSPLPAFIEECAWNLEANLRLFHPKLVVALGAIATARLTGRTIGKARGAIIRPEYNISPWAGDLAREIGFAVLPTWHPAAILRVPSMGGDLVRDFKKIKRFLAGELEPVTFKEHRVG